MHIFINLNNYASAPNPSSNVGVSIINIKSIRSLLLISNVEQIQLTAWNTKSIGFTVSGQSPTITDVNTFISTYCPDGLLDIEGDLFYMGSDGTSKTYFESNKIITDESTIELYKLNCPRNKLRKAVGTEITFVQKVIGHFKNIVSIKNPIIDLTGIHVIDLGFNYVYIPTLRRYYFVDKVELVSADTTRLSLIEDVLTSFADLIAQQRAFINRNEILYSDYIADDLVTYDHNRVYTTQLLSYATAIFPTSQEEERARACYVVSTVVSS